MRKIYLISIIMVLISLGSYAQWSDTDQMLNIEYWNNVGASDGDYGYFGMNLRYKNSQWESFHSTLSGMAMKFVSNGIDFITAPANTIPTSITTLMRIQSNGNVGIGTTDPLDNLEVSSITGGIIRLSNSTQQLTAGTIAGKINFYKADVSYGAGVVSYIQSRSFDAGGSYALDFATGDQGGGGNPITTRMTINYNGNVGIGTTAPQSPLHIKNDDESAEYPTLTSRGDVLQLFEVKNNSFEIGVAGAANTRRSWILSRHSDISGTYGKYYSTLHLQPDIGDKSKYKGVAIGYSPSFHVTDSTHLAVNGKVGIGTLSPNSKLTVQTGYITLIDNSYDEWIFRKHRTDGTHNMGFKAHQASEMSIWAGIEAIRIKSNGNVGIGTTETGTHKLAVEGTIGAREIKVEAGTWSDFVFNTDYELKGLEEVEAFIEENNHLPGIPSEQDVKENGIQVGEMNAKLLQKIEELTLYMIEQNKETKTMKAQLDKLSQENEKLKNRIEELETTE